MTLGLARLVFRYLGSDVGVELWLLDSCQSAHGVHIGYYGFLALVLFNLLLELLQPVFRGCQWVIGR